MGMRSIAAVLAALGVFAAACSDSGGGDTTASPTTTTTTTVLQAQTDTSVPPTLQSTTTTTASMTTTSTGGEAGEHIEFVASCYARFVIGSQRFEGVTDDGPPIGILLDEGIASVTIGEREVIVDTVEFVSEDQLTVFSAAESLTSLRTCL